MLAHINMFIVLFFSGLILSTVVILLLVTPKAAKDVQKMVANRRGNSLGGKDKGISGLMEELSRTRDMQRIKEIQESIWDEVEKMQNETSNKVQLRKVDIIKKWLDAFSADQHIIDLKKKGISQQVQFDNDKKDFKLMILKK